MLRCMHRTNIYLEQRQTEALDRLAAAEGVSRAEIIRRLLDRALGDDDVDAGVAAIDASFGVAADLEPAARDDVREHYLDELWRRSW